MIAETTPLDFHLRTRWVTDTLEEANKIVAAKKTAGNSLENALEPATSAFLELTGSFVVLWRQFLEAMEQTGLPGKKVQETIRNADTFLSAAQQLGKLLIDRSHIGRQKLVDAIERLNDIQKTAREIEVETTLPDWNDESYRKRLEELQPDDGEDLEDVLARLKTGAPV